jgi:uncharacterized SAM-binding protein YcdF (DUF218 family)
MFLFKKIVAPFLLPVPFCVGLLLVGLLLLWFTRRQRAGKLFVTAGTLLLTLLGYGFASSGLLRPLERSYAPVVASEAALKPVRWIVVLGGGSSSDESLPASERLTEASMARLVEGVRLQRQLQGSRLLLSGGSVYGSGRDSETMRALALELGVEPGALVLDDVSPDTESQAQVVKSQLGTEEFFLVTSASHMPRAVALFRKAGTNPLPAPTHFLAQANHGHSPGDFFPGSSGLRKSETSIYEYLGTVWARIRRKI